MTGNFRTGAFLALLLLCASCGNTRAELEVHGDSTAVGSREGLLKIFNFAPKLDGARWPNRLGKALSVDVHNTGVGGSTMAATVARMKRHGHFDRPSIIYDRINDEESPEAYLAALTQAVGLLKGDFLIMPQVPNSAGAEDTELRNRMAIVNVEVRRRWPDHTLSRKDTVALLTDLYEADTRYDGVHRNAKGQGIEAVAVRRWIDAQHWYRQ
ncbi:MAG: hypothetical protein V4707_08820 [Pseudomonadota bacterium]